MKNVTNNTFAKYLLTAIIAVTLGAYVGTPTPARSAMSDSLDNFIDLFTGSAQNESVGFPTSTAREPVREIWVVATAYSSTPDQTDDTPCITANGHDLCEHYDKYNMGNTIAANFMPFESTVTLPEVFGDKEFKVRDRMNSRYGYGRIDVWMPTREEAKQFGVKWIKMNVYN